MEPATIAAIATAGASLITAIGLWIKSRANMNDSFAKIIAARETTKKERDTRADETDLKINTLESNHKHLAETVSRLETELENNTNGLKDDISELRKETNQRISQLEDKISANQKDNNQQFEKVLTAQYESTLALSKQIAELNGQLKGLKTK